MSRNGKDIRKKEENFQLFIYGQISGQVSIKVRFYKGLSDFSQKGTFCEICMTVSGQRYKL